MSTGTFNMDTKSLTPKTVPPKSPVARSRSKDGPVWRCVEVLRSGPNPRWRCKSCHAEFTGAPCRIAQHILGEGGTGQIKACTCPQEEYVSLLRATMSLDQEGKLVKKVKLDKDEGGQVMGAGAGAHSQGFIGMGVSGGLGTSAGSGAEAGAGSGTGLPRGGHALGARSKARNRGGCASASAMVCWIG